MPDPVIFFVDAIGDRLWRFDPGTGFANAVISTSTGAAEWDLWDLLFDGVSIWITDAANNTVAQLNPSGSIVLNTLPTGSRPTALAFDGSMLWVANSGSNTVTRLFVPHSADNLQWAFGGVAATGTNPSWMAFDGANMWVTNLGSNTMTQMRASDMAVLATHPTGPSPAAVVFDGTHLWVANSGSNTVTRYLPGAPS